MQTRSSSVGSSRVMVQFPGGGVFVLFFRPPPEPPHLPLAPHIPCLFSSPTLSASECVSFPLSGFPMRAVGRATLGRFQTSLPLGRIALSHFSLSTPFSVLPTHFSLVSLPLICTSRTALPGFLYQAPPGKKSRPSGFPFLVMTVFGPRKSRP